MSSFMVALFNRPVIEETPLQIYCSGFVFAPEKSIIRKRFNKCIPTWIKTEPKVQPDGGGTFQTLEGHFGSVSSVAFSPQGKQVASATRINISWVLR